MIRVGRLRGLFDPLLDALPSLGSLAVLVVGVVRMRQGAVTVEEVVSVAFLFTVLAFPVRAIGWVLDRAAAQRGRLGAGAARCSPRPATCATARGRVPGPADAPVSLAFRDVEFAYDGGAAGAARRHVRRAGRAGPWPWSARPAPASRPSRRSPPGWSTRPPGGSSSTASTSASSRRPTLAGRGRAGAADSVRLRRHRSRQRGAGPRPASTTTTVRAALRLAQADGFVRPAARRAGHHGRRARHLAVRRPAPAAHPGPGARRRPAAAGPRRRHQRGRPAGRGGDPGRAARRGGSSDPGRGLPAGHHRARRRGGLPRARAGGRPRHRTGSCSPPCRATPTWSPRTSGPTPSGNASTPTTKSAIVDEAVAAEDAAPSPSGRRCSA